MYICSPYAGDIENNTAAARRYSRFAVEAGYIPIAPHLLFPQFLDDSNPKERELGLFFGNAILSKCAEMWVFGDRISEGMEAEIKRATWKGHRIRYFSETCEEVTTDHLSRFPPVGTEDSKTTQVLRKEEPPMSESRPNKAVTDEELIGVLTAISVVSRRLARKLIQLNQTSQSQEGGKRDEQNERNGSDHQRVTGYCIFY